MILHDIKQHIKHIQKGGIDTFLDKLIKLPSRLLLTVIDISMLPVSIPIVLLIRFARPVYHIKMGYFYGGRIGHFAMDTTMAAVKDKNDVLELYYFWPGPKNKQWARMVKRELNVYYWVRLLCFANSIIPGGNDHIAVPGLQDCDSRDIKGLVYHSDFVFKFSDLEDDLAKSWLEEKGWSCGEKIVCIIVRDDAFLSTKNWSYHSYRNSDISSYIPAMEMLASKGYWVFRMGSVMRKPLQMDNPRIVDYAFDSTRNDFFDVWLFANCSLCISTGTGPDTISDSYRIPILHLNYTPISYMWSWSNAVYVPKKLYWSDSGNLLSLSEYYNNAFWHTDAYETAKIHIENLTEEEITAAVIERIERIEGTWVESLQGAKLQKTFWEVSKSNSDFTNLNSFIHPEACVASSFLLDHPEWLR